MQAKFNVSYNNWYAGVHNNQCVVHLNDGIKQTFEMPQKGLYYSNMRDVKSLETKATILAITDIASAARFYRCRNRRQEQDNNNRIKQVTI